MQGAVIKEIAERVAQPQLVGGFILRPDGWTVDDPASLVKPGPLAAAVVLSTLASLCDYARENRDVLKLECLTAHVVSPTEVRLFGPLDERARVRETFVSAKVDNLMDNFLGRFMPIEDFILGLQVRFTDEFDRARVLALLGTVKSEVVQTSYDDGTTQIVEARAGAVLKTQTAVPNPMTLQPYRTFREVQQPESLFVLRVKQQQNDLPQAGLFEADGGAWKLEASTRVTRWLRTSLPETVAVLG